MVIYHMRVRISFLKSFCGSGQCANMAVIRFQWGLLQWNVN